MNRQTFIDAVVNHDYSKEYIAVCHKVKTLAKEFANDAVHILESRDSGQDPKSGAGLYKYGSLVAGITPEILRSELDMSQITNMNKYVMRTVIDLMIHHLTVLEIVYFMHDCFTSKGEFVDPSASIRESIKTHNMSCFDPDEMAAHILNQDGEHNDCSVERAVQECLSNHRHFNNHYLWIKYQGVWSPRRRIDNCTELWESAVDEIALHIRHVCKYDPRLYHTIPVDERRATRRHHPDDVPAALNVYRRFTEMAGAIVLIKGGTDFVYSDIEHVRDGIIECKCSKTCHCGTFPMQH